MKPGIPSSMGKKMTLEEAQELARRDKRRLLLMGGGAIALAAFYVFARMNEEGQGTGGSLPGSQNAEVPLEPAVETIPFDQADLLASILDGTPEERLNVSNEALTSLLYYTKLLTRRNYEALGIEDLDEDRCKTISADPGSARVAPLRARNATLSRT